MRSGLFAAPIEEILGDAHYFPAHVDFDANRLFFVETSRARLTATPFLDGRTPIAEGAMLEVVLSEALEARWPVPSWPDRFIFHVAFCGSTLLGTLLDVAGRSFAEREPQVLVDIAGAELSQPEPLVRSTLDLMCALLRRPWRSGEVNLCKPSNWANNLIPLLTRDPQRIRPLFVATDKRGYLYALFRGGRERMAYVIRATEHLLQSFPGGRLLWQRATAGVADPLELAARIALVSLHVQLQLFEDAMAGGNWGRPHLLTLHEIEDDPLHACKFAAAALDLELPTEDLEAVIAERAGRYAKDPRSAYSREVRDAQNRRIESAYGAIIDRALDWAALGNLKNDCGVLVRPKRPAILSA